MGTSGESDRVIAFPVSDRLIDEIEPMDCWFAPNTLGFSKEEMDAVADGKASRELSEKIGVACHLAHQRLVQAKCAGVQFWMTPRRAMC